MITKTTIKLTTKTIAYLRGNQLVVFGNAGSPGDMWQSEANDLVRQNHIDIIVQVRVQQTLDVQTLDLSDALVRIAIVRLPVELQRVGPLLVREEHDQREKYGSREHGESDLDRGDR